jgi:hypothetical protein
VELNSLWLLTCLFLPNYLHREKSRETVLNYGLAFINVEPSPARMWCPALISSNEWNWRKHNGRGKTIRNWLKGKPPLNHHLNIHSISMGADRILSERRQLILNEESHFSKGGGQPVNSFHYFYPLS